MNDIYVYHIALPLSVRGTTVVNNDASYTVFINSRLSPEKQAEAERHERYHIENDHLYRCDDIARQEELANTRPQEESPRFGFVRHGENVLYWEKLSPGQEAEEIRDGDILRRAVAAESRKTACIDIFK